MRKTSSRTGEKLEAKIASLEGELAEKQAEIDQLKRDLRSSRSGTNRTLREVESHFRSIVDYAPYFITIVDHDLNITFINRSPEGVPIDQIIGSSIDRLVSPQHAKRARRILRNVLKCGEAANYELSGLGPNGNVAWYRTHAAPLRSGEEIIGLVLMSSDITKERYQTEALKAGKRYAESARVRDQALLNSIGEGLIVVNEEGRIANINPSGAAMLGFRPEELIGEWFAGAILALDEDGEKLDPMERPAMRALTTGRIISQVVRYKRKDGSHFPVAVTISPVAVQGKPIGAVEVFRDLTQERELEQAKEEFVSLASHQLRTPATGVKAYISMLLDGYAGTVSPHQRGFLEKVLESNERQLRIVNDMLTVARADAGHLTPELSEIDLRSLLQDTIDEQRPIFRERQQDLEVTMPSEQVCVKVDSQMMRMALENLISNASKYTAEKGLVRVTLKQTDGRVVIEVQDTGVGISQEDMPKLFKRFSRIDNPLSTKRGGSGLGLYLAQNIILLHRGALSVDSKVGRGTTFSVDLPILASRAVKQSTTRKGLSV